MSELSKRLSPRSPQGGLAPHPRVANAIAVGSGKGGVGKSTTTVNLALALQQQGLRVGILDADIYGPSIPTMLDLSGRPESTPEKKIIPMRALGIETMSIGFLVEDDSPMIWRGPMATQALTQFFNDTLWDDLDVLLIDLPPGTGDIQLTLSQKIPVAGAVVVTTPQDVATMDARKAIAMFEKVNIPVLGLVENMAVHVCSNCGHAEHIFGSGGGQAMADRYNVPLLGSLPLDMGIREQADAGTPIVAASPEHAASRAYAQLAAGLIKALQERPRAVISLSTQIL